MLYFCTVSRDNLLLVGSKLTTYFTILFYYEIQLLLKSFNIFCYIKASNTKIRPDTSEPLNKYNIQLLTKKKYNIQFTFKYKNKYIKYGQVRKTRNSYFGIENFYFIYFCNFLIFLKRTDRCPLVKRGPLCWRHKTVRTNS